jgi:hypothetical protein
MHSLSRRRVGSVSAEGVTAPDLGAVFTRWQRHRISSREVEAVLVSVLLGRP